LYHVIYRWLTLQSIYIHTLYVQTINLQVTNKLSLEIAVYKRIYNGRLLMFYQTVSIICIKKYFSRLVISKLMHRVLQWNTVNPTSQGTGEKMSDHPCCRIMMPWLIRHFSYFFVIFPNLTRLFRHLANCRSASKYFQGKMNFLFMNNQELVKYIALTEKDKWKFKN